MKIKDFGEFNIIEYISNTLSKDKVQTSLSNSLDIQIDVGDDTAAWKTQSGLQLATTDTMVDQIHFILNTSNLIDIGWKSIATNLSDIASMGGTPTTALITLGLPGEMKITDLKSLYHGIIECASTYNTKIIGGDIVKSPVLFITVAVYGVCENPTMQRSLLKENDLIGITGFTGLSKAGLELSKPKNELKNLTPNNSQMFYNAHFRPKPKIKEGKILKEIGAICAMDISDGLFSDLNKMLTASQIGAVINQSSVPIHPEISKVFPNSDFEMATNGGEDYEILFGIASNKLDKVKSLLPESHIIGKACSGEAGVIELIADDKIYKLNQFNGWDHFRQ
tara:strand:+ start:65 stop:1075 length:1011 start_codon:yes stop_codon:yes gene_type:complete